MATERRACKVCGKTDCERFGHFLCSGTYNGRTGEWEERPTEEYTITVCELKQLQEETGLDYYFA